MSKTLLDFSLTAKEWWGLKPILYLPQARLAANLEFSMKGLNLKWIYVGLQNFCGLAGNIKCDQVFTVGWGRWGGIRRLGRAGWLAGGGRVLGTATGYWLTTALFPGVKPCSLTHGRVGQGGRGLGGQLVTLRCQHRQGGSAQNPSSSSHTSFLQHQRN